MGFSNFFRINMPYGMKRTANNEWMAFNREYVPLGYNKKVGGSIYSDDFFSDLPLYTEYKGLTEELIRKNFESDNIRENDRGEIQLVWLYSDATNPSDDGAKSEDWDNYFRIIKFLSKFEGKNIW